ncbi:ribosomal protein S18 acetylase RimI-like enzyme [Deinococcus sp. HSC-46F16]|uniref:GNAT family N-acetyltransferase n=1 Tax=Deinococcus sp. HSC-46F16 TaxID=2910968 RepID=UPI00209E89E3|nr:GNAT family N-acetyltransferase [Deinococcus sp. HSC-46F16]MCP2015699.1 ribosomal protein S18 acetylase RimI-like enzyme [Deinococcus sp. HSC-46F16]
MDVRPWHRADLTALEPLLAASFGRADFDLADEQAYFPDPAPPGWVVAWDAAGTPLGFLRFFAAGGGVQVAELYAVPGPQQPEILAALLRAFSSSPALAAGERLRFDLFPNDVARRALIEQHLEVTDVHRYLRLDREVRSAGHVPSEPLSLRDAQAAAEVLGVLKDYPPEELRHLWAGGDLAVTWQKGAVVGAAHLQSRGGGEREIVALAVAAEARGTGEGARLVDALLRRQPPGTARLTLQVREDNAAARRLYTHCGFRERPQGREVWLFTRPRSRS